MTTRRWQVLVLVAIALGALSMFTQALLFARTTGQQDKLNAESVSRRDQNCVVFERMHQTDVTQLRDTYGYVADLSRQQLAEHLNSRIVAQLPKQEKRERKSLPPPYCSRPGVGLDDRKLEPEPKRPPEVDRLLR